MSSVTHSDEMLLQRNMRRRVEALSYPQCFKTSVYLTSLTGSSRLIFAHVLPLSRFDVFLVKSLWAIMRFTYEEQTKQALDDCNRGAPVMDRPVKKQIPLIKT